MCSLCAEECCAGLRPGVKLQCMAASKAACRHDGVDDEYMVTYMVLAPGDPERREHVHIIWCARCGALGTRRYTSRQYGNLTEWTLPDGKTKGSPRRKSPVPVTTMASTDPAAGRKRTGTKKARTKKRGRLAPI